jgi:hypothetical protein
MQPIPKHQMERVHYNYGGGRGSYLLRHLPSGVSVHRECLPDIPNSKLLEMLEGELKDKLIALGISFVPADHGNG